MSVSGVGGGKVDWAGGEPEGSGGAPQAAPASEGSVARGASGAARPFFTRFLEGQGTASTTSTLTEKYPSDAEDGGAGDRASFVTLKYPSDNEDSGPRPGGSPSPAPMPPLVPSPGPAPAPAPSPSIGDRVTLKFPSDNEDGGGRIPTDLPVTVTEAVGEFGREVSGMLQDRLAHENDAGLVRTLDRFLDAYQHGGRPNRNDPDFNAAFGGLATKGKLDDLALELYLDDLEFTKANPNALYYGRLNALADAIDKFGNEKLGAAWKKTGEKLENMRPDDVRDGRMAGSELAREMRTSVADGDRKLMTDAAKALLKGVELTYPAFGPGAPPPAPSVKADKYEAGRMNAAFRNASKQGVLDDFVKELKKTNEGKSDLKALNAMVERHGTPTVKVAWAAAMNQGPIAPTTRKFPSDNEDGGGGGPMPSVTLKFPSDSEG